MTDAGAGEEPSGNTVWSRVAHRWGRNGRRGIRGVLHSGPGRLAGVVLTVDADDRSITVTGWAATPAAPVAAVVVTLDGQPVAVATTGLPTPTVQPLGTVTRWSDTAGWEAWFERPRGCDGDALVGALVVRVDALVDEALPLSVTIPPLPSPEEVEELPTFGDGRTHVDHPAHDAVLVPPLTSMSGWAVDQEIDRVEVTIGAGEPQRARLLAVVRPDVAQVHRDEPLGPLSGWTIVADVPASSAERSTTVHIDAVAGRRRFRIGERRVAVAPDEGTPTMDPERVDQLAQQAGDMARQHVSADARTSLLVGTHDLGLGGGQLYLHELLRHLLAPGDVECTVLSNADGVLRGELERWGARVHVVGPLARTGTDYEQRMLELALLANLTTANVAIANTAGCFWLIDLAARLGLPSLWALHESFRLDRFVVEGLGGIDNHVRGRFVDAFRQAEHVIFEADATAQLFSDLIPSGRSRRVDYGIDLERIDAFRATSDRRASREAKGFAGDEVVLLCLGTFEPRKAQGALCAAFARIVDQHPRARLALVGDTGTPYSEALHEIVERLQLAGRVSLFPVTPDIDDWYHVADGFVLASDVESLPRSMMEVMAFEVPVLGASVFGVPELVTDGVEGLLFEPRCVGALTDVLDRFFWLDEGDRLDMGRRARQRVVPSRASHRYAAEYRSLIDGLTTGA